MTTTATTSSSARALVPEDTLWHLTREVAAAMLPAHAVQSLLPANLDCSAPPLRLAQMLEASTAHTETFRVAARFPSFMSAAECNALHVIATSLAHGAEVERASKATLATAAAYKSLFKTSLGMDAKQGIASYLKRTGSTLTLHDRLQLGAKFRASFVKQDWPHTAMRYADAWQKAFRGTRDEAEAWSAYLYLQASCGAFESDPNFVHEITSAVGGIGGGIGRKYASLDSLVTQVHALSSTRTQDDAYVAAKCTLLQATHTAEAEGSEILKEVNAQQCKKK